MTQDSPRKNRSVRIVGLMMIVSGMALAAVPTVSANDYRCYECDVIIDQACRTIGIGKELIGYDIEIDAGRGGPSASSDQVLDSAATTTCAYGARGIDTMETVVGYAITILSNEG